MNWPTAFVIVAGLGLVSIIVLVWAVRDTTPKPQPVVVVFDGPPGAVGGRFVEAEDAAGNSISGTWSQDDDGHWRLYLVAPS